jgi:uncharacterized Zn finger protein (UPF0148 family)
MMHQYTCPKCKTVLKREQPVAEGKKIKCPKCQNIFAAAAAKAEPAKAGKSKHDDDDDRNPYAVMNEDKEDEKMREEKQRAAMGLVKDRFEKSARGPAISVIVRPASYLLGAGVITCTLAFACLFVGIFPLVFSDFYKQGPNDPKLSKEQKAQKGQEEYDAMVRRSMILIPASVFVFAFGSLICVGAFKMRALESQPWSWVGAIMSIPAAPGNGAGVFSIVFYLARVLFVDTMGLDTSFAVIVASVPAAVAVIFTLVAGIWCITALTNEVVKDAFAEEKDAEV